ncbi:hypothetical protein IB276_36055 [Ensifer sp. ENS04]|uniref:hypothetical protein n=1 Tax=unclassified Ensifer TaxID=2633371 RepID=UPI0008E7EC89|nr:MULTISPECIES: hypothetical protein [unclassified Ensifer]MBD9544846.1 hypothetical protein [Ensifer sp. ENS04]SFH31197.1 hypothetical protein SAMN05216459_1256 [Ensifer sp. OV372]
MRAAATAWGDVLQVRKREDNELLWARASANVARAVSDLFHYLLVEDGGEITERVREVASNAIHLFEEVIDVMRRVPNDYAATLQDVPTIHANVRSYGSAIQLLQEAREFSKKRKCRWHWYVPRNAWKNRSRTSTIRLGRERPIAERAAQPARMRCPNRLTDRFSSFLQLSLRLPSVRTCLNSTCGAATTVHSTRADH